jgi:hypothetical protein
LACVKELKFSAVDTQELEYARRLKLSAVRHAQHAKEAEAKAKDIFLRATLAQDMQGKTWRFGNISCLYRHASRKAYIVPASEYDELRLTVLKDKSKKQEVQEDESDAG